ncbi:porin family protein [Flavobacterium sp.]|uniref:porin family protein n=1 Tax=Flavobacterium sp. TaxID=239 RepID=UPI0035280391
MKINCTLLVLFCSLLSWAQKTTDKNEQSVYKVVDSLFREDQFYFSISYNLVQNRPSGFKQYSFSSGLTAGFLRDIPLSKDRKWAIAPGLGYSYNNIKQFINSADVVENPDVIEDIRTKISTHGIDLPFEIRWRNAIPTNHKFWRIYTGFKATYLVDATLKLETTTANETLKVLDNVNRWQYGVYIAAGFNTWNFYAHYGLNPIFKEGNKMTNLNFGFMFYIL